MARKSTPAGKKTARKRVRPFIDLSDERPSKKTALQKVVKALADEDEDETEDTDVTPVKKGKRDGRKHVKGEAETAGKKDGSRKILLRDALGMSKDEATTFAVQLSRLSSALLSEL